MDVMRSFGIPVPKGGMATNLDEVTQVVKLSVFQNIVLITLFFICCLIWEKRMRELSYRYSVTDSSQEYLYFRISE